MTDATYVGAGMPCGNCGNPLTPGQPHKCGRVGNPYAPSPEWKPGQDTFTSQAAGIWDEGFAAGRAAATPDPPDEAAIRADERERLSARVYENGWCPTCGTKTADPGVIPGPDPGACPACGGWRKAGMIHRCPPGATPEDERARIGAEERKRITDLLRDGAARRELRANRPGNAAATTLMASWEALRLAADVIERSAGSAGSDGEDR